MLSKKAFTISVVIISVIVILTGCAVAKKSASLNHRPTEQQIKQVQLFNETSEEMYQSMKKGKVMEARSKLIQMNSQVTHISFNGITSADGMNALTDALTEAARTFNAVKFSQSEGEIAAVKVRLASDALSHPNHPLWQLYHNLIQKDLTEIEKAVKSSKSRDALQAMEQLNQHYAVIKPSLRISRPAVDVEKMDSLMVFLQGQLGAKMLQTKIIEDGLNSYRETVNGIFTKNNASAFLYLGDNPYSAYLSVIIGTFIISVLTFAGWRIYKNGRQHIVIPIKEETQRH